MAYDPSQSLQVNLQLAGLTQNEMGAGGLSPQFLSSIQTAFARSGAQGYGEQAAFDLISRADPARAQADPIGYANELLTKSGVQGFGGTNDWMAANTSLPGHNESFTPFNPVDVLQGAGDAASDLSEQPGFWPMVAAATGGAAMGGGLSGAISGLGTGAPVGLAEEAAMLGVPASSAAVPAVSGAASTLAPTASVLSRIIDGKATPADWMSVAGTVGIAGLGMYGADKQADSLSGIAERSRADLAPFLGKANEWLADPMAYIEGPGAASMDATLKRLSAERGNPIDSPTALALATQAGMQDWRNAVTGFANIGLSGEDSRNSLMANAAGADAEGLNALGYGIGEITQPKKRSLADVLAAKWGLS